MQAVDRMLLRVTKAVLAPLHRAQTKSLAWAADALVHGTHGLTLSGIGRDSRSCALTKSSIKRADRLLGNQKLHGRLDIVFGAVARILVGDSKRVLIAVDWSKIDEAHHVLAASVIHDGRSAAVLHEVHPTELLGSGAVEAAFVERLRRVIPDSCRPTLLTDAGFRNPWMRAVREAGMDFICRLMPDVMLRLKDDTHPDGWTRARDTAHKAGACADDLGAALIAKTTPNAARAVRGSRPGPLRPRKRRRRASARNNAEKKAKKMARLPWLLATSRDDVSAARIIAMYACRFQCEETFRDNKSPRFGWSLRHTFCRTSNRYDILLTVAMLAALVLHLVGRIAERRGWHRHFQANTERTRRVVSLVYLARALLRSPLHRRLDARDLVREVRRMRMAIRERAA